MIINVQACNYTIGTAVPKVYGFIHNRLSPVSSEQSFPLRVNISGVQIFQNGSERGQPMIFCQGYQDFSKIPDKVQY